MDVRVSQTAIAAQLNGAFGGTRFTAQELPETDADYQRAVPDPLAYVVYTGSETLEIISTDPVVQRRKLKFNVEIYGKLLYNENGVFAVRALLESALVGFKPPNCERLYLVKDEISKGQDSIWSHVYNFECQTVLVQNNFSEPYIVTPFTGLLDGQTTFNEDYNTDFGEGLNT